MRIDFFKYHGTGNDFILLDNRDGRYSDLGEERIQALCKRRFGIGSDGLMLVQGSERCDFEMTFFNPDASQSLCGNGSRCAIHFAESLGLAKAEGQFITTDGMHRYKRGEENKPAVQMNPTGLPIKRCGHHYLNTGSPHLVVPCANVDEVQVQEEGSRLRRHGEFEAEGGCNVNFVSPMGKNCFGVRTYERGVEAETLSCGTGVTAVALIMAHLEDAESPLTIHTHGGVLELSFQKEADGFSDIWLRGPVQFVYQGHIHA